MLMTSITTTCGESNDCHGGAQGDDGDPNRTAVAHTSRLDPTSLPMHAPVYTGMHHVLTAAEAVAADVLAVLPCRRWTTPRYAASRITPLPEGKHDLCHCL